MQRNNKPTYSSFLKLAIQNVIKRFYIYKATIGGIECTVTPRTFFFS